jgi:hypothetical protein
VAAVNRITEIAALSEKIKKAMTGRWPTAETRRARRFRGGEKIEKREIRQEEDVFLCDSSAFSASRR